MAEEGDLTEDGVLDDEVLDKVAGGAGSAAATTHELAHTAQQKTSVGSNETLTVGANQTFDVGSRSKP